MPPISPSFQPLFQPNEFTCGPTCLSMILQASCQSLSSPPPLLSIDSIAHLMGCTPDRGTTDIEMQAGINAFNLSCRRVVFGSDALKLKTQLQSHLQSGQPALLRVFLSGIKHWVVATSCTPSSSTSEDFILTILDPALGPRTLHYCELEEDLLARQGDVWFFDRPDLQAPHLFIPEVSRLSSFSSSSQSHLLEHAINLSSLSLSSRILGSLPPHHPRVLSQSESIKSDLSSYEWDPEHILLLSVHHHGQRTLIGAYLTLPQTLEQHLPIAYFNPQDERIQSLLVRYPSHQKGLFGVALAIDPSWQNLRYGRLLKRAARDLLNADYSFGYQLKSLNNHAQWARSRPDFIDLGGLWFSCGPLTPCSFNASLSSKKPRP